MTKLKKLKNKALELWKHEGRETADCEMCVTMPPEKRINYTYLNAHHVILKDCLTLRFDLRNRCWLCPAHHNRSRFSAHLSPLWFAEWFEQKRTDDYRYLMEKQHVLSKFTIKDMEEIIEDLV